jgi:hypothetical protein
MTSKRIVREFLDRPNNIVFPMFCAEDENGDLVDVYEKEFKDAIIDCINQAMTDGYKQGHLEAEGLLF